MGRYKRLYLSGKIAVAGVNSTVDRIFACQGCIKLLKNMIQLRLH